MAKLQKPKGKKGAVPKMEDASNNLGKEKEAIKAMSFKMPISFYKDLKMFAYEHDLSFTEVFKRSFYQYRDSVNK